MQSYSADSNPTRLEFAAMDAYDDGREANQDGKPQAANPHAAGTRLHTAWDDGWQTQDAVRQQWYELHE